MILITGATGTIGSQLLHQLTSRGEAVRAMTRNPGAVRAELGVDLVRADFDEPASLAAAVADVRAVFLLTAPTSPTPDHDLAMLETARSAGVTTVVKLSAIGTGETIGDNQTVGAWHLRAEHALRSSGMAWTVLRPSSFASNVLGFASTINAGHPVPNMTGAATQGVIDPRDVAAVAAEVLTTPGHAGRTYTLTGPELLSVPDQAAILESVLDRPVATVDVPLDIAREQMLQHDIDQAAVDAAITGMAWAQAGHNAILTQDVPQVLRRPATTFTAWVHDHQDAFRPTTGSSRPPSNSSSKAKATGSGRSPPLPPSPTGTTTPHSRPFPPTGPPSTHGPRPLARDGRVRQEVGVTDLVGFTSQARRRRRTPPRSRSASTA